jgi:NADP-dependent 3-hydroxy acid dehydrogenase YdfG
MHQPKKFDEMILLGGYGENSTLSEELVNVFLARGTAVALIAKPETQIKDNDYLLKFFGDMNDGEFVAKVFDELNQQTAMITAYIHTAGSLLRSPLLKTSQSDYRRIMDRNFFCAINISQQLINHAIAHNYEQHLIFMGATASLRGGKEFSAFSAAKFALRGFVQSLTREFSSQGIHACHLIVDGIIEGKRAKNIFKKSDDDSIKGKDLAELIDQLIRQPRSTWTQEIDVRPSSEKF